MRGFLKLPLKIDPSRIFQKLCKAHCNSRKYEYFRRIEFQKNLFPAVRDAYFIQIFSSTWIAFFKRRPIDTRQGLGTLAVCNTDLQERCCQFVEDHLGFPLREDKKTNQQDIRQPGKDQSFYFSINCRLGFKAKSHALFLTSLDCAKSDFRATSR